MSTTPQSDGRDRADDDPTAAISNIEEDYQELIRHIQGCYRTPPPEPVVAKHLADLRQGSAWQAARTRSRSRVLAVAVATVVVGAVASLIALSPNEAELVATNLVSRTTTAWAPSGSAPRAKGNVEATVAVSSAREAMPESTSPDPASVTDRPSTTTKPTSGATTNAVGTSSSPTVSEAPIASTTAVVTTPSTTVFSSPSPEAASCAGLAATLVGTNGDDEIVGTEGADVIVGNGGNDVISGLGGDDTICGGNGKDELHGGPGDDFLDGGNGKDSLFGGDGVDELVGGKGKDELFPDVP